MRAPDLSGDAVARLRVRGRADPVDARLAMERVLRDVTLGGGAVPAGSIVVVRRLEDPAPGRLRLDRATAAPVSAAWARAVERHVAALASRAHRPALGAPPAGAEAVVFADPAELLVALARDAVCGGAGAWWWQALGLGPAGIGAPRAWLEAPHDVPAALEQLPGELAARWVASLDPGTATELAVAVAVAHAAPALARAVVAPRPGLAAAAPPEAVLRRAPAAREAGAVGRAALVAVAGALRAAPAEARSAAFASSVARWIAAAEPAEGDHTSSRLEPHAAEDDDARASSSAPGAGGGRRPSRRDVGPRSPRRVDPPAARDEASSGSVPVAGDRDAAPAADPPGRPDDPARGAAVLGPSLDRHGPKAGTTGADDAGVAGDAHAKGTAEARAPTSPAVGHRDGPPSGSADVAAPTDDPWATGVASDLAGALFLLNLAQALGLYGDFTAPGHRGLALDPWDLVTLLTRALDPDAPAEDPLWPLLAGLAGRDPEDPPGGGFTPSASWCLPPAWRAPFEPGTVPRLARGRLRVDHPAGFPVVDVAIARAERRPSLDRWTRWLADYVGARLALALGEDDPRRAARVLVRCAGHVRVTPSRVDATFDLAAHPIAIRFAGLDRTPGWIPAAGRTVAFHFA